MTDSGTAATLHEFAASDRGARTGEPAMTLTPPDPYPTPTAPTPGDEVAFSNRTPGPSRLRVAAVAGAALALAVGVVATSLAASPAPTSTGSTNTSTTGLDPVTTGLGPAPFFALDPAVDGDGAPDLDHLGIRGFRDITIKAISGSNVTLATDDGWTRTIAVTGSVELTKGGQAIRLSDLAVGDQVRFRQTRNADGTYTVEAIAVVVPSVRGTVSDVTASSFKITTRDGSVWTIAVNGSTTYKHGTGAGTLADVTNGTVALVQGTKTADNALTALSVRVAADRAVGTVTARTANSITIRQRDGSSLTIHVGAATTYRVAGKDTATLADITVDMGIGVSGRKRADGSIDADAVAAGMGRGFFGGHGPKGGAFDGFDGPVLDPAGGDASQG
jgi:hypothetical protein